MDDPRLASSRLHADVDRLRAQAGLSWPREARALAQLGLHDGMSILEVGSGPGFITELLLEGLPHATITSVELDPTMCELARTRLAAHLGQRLEIVQTSILYTDLAGERFDFALARFVFQHLAAADLAASEILRLLKPGGQLAIIDIDDDLGGLVTPNIPAFAQLAHRVRQTQASSAGDREIGRKLWRLLVENGYVQLGLDMVVFHSDELGLDAFLPQYDPERYRVFVAHGGLSSEEWDRYRQAYEQFKAAPDAFILQLLMLASGRKPSPS
jgi:ubiquinone/menaquinone biosynthesis C-methylase UbiE